MLISKALEKTKNLEEKTIIKKNANPNKHKNNNLLY